MVRHVAPTVLIGTSGKPGVFTEIRRQGDGCSDAGAHRAAALQPDGELGGDACRRAELERRSGARGDRGSPFDPVEVDGRTRLIGQANNVFVFPGVGLGAIASGTREVTDNMFLVAATTLASMVPPDRIEQGAIFPSIANLRGISRAIAVGVACEARDEGAAPMATDAEIEAAVEASVWTPRYEPVG